MHWVLANGKNFLKHFNRFCNTWKLWGTRKDAEGIWKRFYPINWEARFVGRPRWPQDYTLYNFDELPPFGKVAVYCCILRMLCLLCHFSKLISAHCIDGGRWWIKNSLSRNPSFHVFILFPNLHTIFHLISSSMHYCLIGSVGFWKVKKVAQLVRSKHQSFALFVNLIEEEARFNWNVFFWKLGRWI